MTTHITERKVTPGYITYRLTKGEVAQAITEFLKETKPFQSIYLDNYPPVDSHVCQISYRIE